MNKYSYFIAAQGYRYEKVFHVNQVVECKYPINNSEAYERYVIPWVRRALNEMIEGQDLEPFGPREFSVTAFTPLGTFEDEEGE